jgi:hypothetical protein
METLTLRQSTIHGSVLGKPIMCTLRGSPSAPQLPVGNYLLLPAVQSPVYGMVMSIQPLGAAGDPAMKSPSQYDLRPAARAADTSPGAVKYSLTALKLSDNVPLPDGVAMYTDSRIKFTDPAAIKFAPAQHKTPAHGIFKTVAQGIYKTVAPAIKFDSASQMASSVVISERPIAGGNGFIASAGFADLVDVVQRAGGVRLTVL